MQSHHISSETKMSLGGGGGTKFIYNTCTYARHVNMYNILEKFEKLKAIHLNILSDVTSLLAIILGKT